MPRVGIALGSNLGDRHANLQAARIHLQRIATPGTAGLHASTYQTEPLLCPPASPLFYNSVTEISYAGNPLDLLSLTQAIEKKLGRQSAPERNAPRMIDLDLLYFGDEILDFDALILPHPRLAERRFVLQPLAEIRPSLILPGHRQTISELLTQISNEQPELVVIPEDSDHSNPKLGLGDGPPLKVQ